MILPGLGLRALDLEQTKSLKADIEKKHVLNLLLGKIKNQHIVQKSLDVSYPYQCPKIKMGNWSYKSTYS